MKSSPLISCWQSMKNLALKPDMQECLARVEAWYAHKVLDRAPVRFSHHNIEYERHRSVEGPWKSPAERWLDVEFQVSAFLESTQGTPFLGETFPVFWPNLSAVVYNLFLGQEARFDDVTVWTRPCVEDLEHPPDLRVQWDNIYFRTVEAMTRRALELAEGRFLVGYTDMNASVDCTLCLRGMEQMCLDVLFQPNALLRLIDKAWEEYPAVYQHFDRMLKSHGQLSVTWMNLPSRETFNVLACDFATNISQEHFDRISMPILRREASLFTHNVFHVDGRGVARHLDSILTLPNLVGVQWVQGYGADQPILQWIPLIEKVQQAGKSVIVDLQIEELEPFLRRVDPTGIMLWIPAEPKDQPEILQKVARW